ncbi:hypothetical protein ILYODFUR_032892 [Ilyodon furcidens]|uniref:Uncharacterized protein n=1 Tax=Ilyodon furcidens TaxID=33524 RepID=A0ABV0VM05_9TELE
MVVKGPGGADCMAARILSVSPGQPAAVSVCMDGWMTDCSLKCSGVLELDKVLYKCRLFNIYHRAKVKKGHERRVSKNQRLTAHNELRVKKECRFSSLRECTIVGVQYNIIGNTTPDQY